MTIVHFITTLTRGTIVHFILKYSGVLLDYDLSRGGGKAEVAAGSQQVVARDGSLPSDWDGVRRKVTLALARYSRGRACLLGRRCFGTRHTEDVSGADKVRV